MSSDDPGVNGLLLVDKPGLAFHALVPPPALDAPAGNAKAFPTSHDVVQQVRRLSKQQRIGHTGTLDPMAGGLLVLCLGWATRLVEYYQGHPKSYRAEVTLGYATDTWDVLGVETERLPVPALTVQAIEQALAPFRGPLLQTPPVYSALKQGGESLHYKARRGEMVTVQPRTVEFHELTLIDFTPPDRFTLDIRCSAGAYVRSLAYDLGRALGTAGTLTGLRRTAAGPFAVAEAHTLDKIVVAAEAGNLPALLLPPGARLDLPTFTADAAVIARLGYGQIVQAAELHALPPGNPVAAAQQSPTATINTVIAGEHAIAQVRIADGVLLGIVRRMPQPTSSAAPAGWRAEKWFA